MTARAAPGEQEMAEIEEIARAIGEAARPSYLPDWIEQIGGVEFDSEEAARAWCARTIEEEVPEGVAASMRVWRRDSVCLHVHSFWDAHVRFPLREACRTCES